MIWIYNVPRCVHYTPFGCGRSCLKSKGAVDYLRILALLSLPSSVKVSAGLIGVIAAHVASIVLFGTIIFLLAKTNPEKFGRLEGVGSQTIHNFIYFSFTTYTTVGYGDYIPVGPIRLISQIDLDDEDS